MHHSLTCKPPFNFQNTNTQKKKKKKKKNKKKKKKKKKKKRHELTPASRNTSYKKSKSGQQKKLKQLTMWRLQDQRLKQVIAKQRKRVEYEKTGRIAVS